MQGKGNNSYTLEKSVDYSIYAMEIYSTNVTNTGWGGGVGGGGNELLVGWGGGNELLLINSV